MYKGKKVIAIIPARGGSKRIPQKNIIPLAGKEMIGWTIGEAKASQYIDTLLVSTDCSKVKEVALNYGADVPFMRVNAVDDYSPVSEATLSALLQAEDHYGDYDVVIQLMANCPLRTTEDIDKGIECFFEKNRESQISFFKFGWMNPWWAHTISDGVPSSLFKKVGRKRSQDLDDLYCPTGAIWICHTKVLKKYKTFYTPNYSAQEIDWVSAMDIDDDGDLEMAKTLLKLREDSL